MSALPLAISFFALSRRTRLQSKFELYLISFMDYSFGFCVAWQSTKTAGMVNLEVQEVNPAESAWS
jgi:hypothetical protein